jgi:hypothetical protein
VIIDPHDGRLVKLDDDDVLPYPDKPLCNGTADTPTATRDHGGVHRHG